MAAPDPVLIAWLAAECEVKPGTVRVWINRSHLPKLVGKIDWPSVYAFVEKKKDERRAACAIAIEL